MNFTASENGATRVIENLVFEPLLPNAVFLPTISRNGSNLRAEVIVGHNRATGMLYTLQVILCGPCLCDELGEDAAELVFVIKGYDSGDHDAEPLVFYSGKETRHHFPSKSFRASVAQLVTTLGCHLVAEMNPKRLIYIAKHPDLPVVAYPKYEALTEKILALGYDCSKYPTSDGRQIWDLQRR